MTERTVTVNGVQLTEGQVREAMARLSAQTTSYKGGDIVLRDGDRDDRWVVLSEYDYSYLKAGYDLDSDDDTDIVLWAASMRNGHIEQFYANEVKDMVLLVQKETK